MNKVCPQKSKFAGHPDYICNPATGVWVKKDGPTGRAILYSIGGAKQKQEKNSNVSLTTIFPTLDPQIPDFSKIKVNKKIENELTLLKNILNVQLTPHVGVEVPPLCSGLAFDVYAKGEYIGRVDCSGPDEMAEKIKDLIAV